MLASFQIKLSLTLASLIIGSLFIANSSYASPDSVAEQTAQDFTEVAKKAIPAVVSIKIKGEEKVSADNSDLGDDFLQQFFGFRQSPSKPQAIQGEASGFIISPEGYIMTNSHVVSEANEIKVILNDGKEFEAKVIGQDPSTDVALIKIDANNLPYLTFGNSDNLKVGQWAIAIGTPYGLQATLTVGVVSATSRNNLDLATIEDFIQTDAAINRGNSGGPLLNIKGDVIGMNTAIVSNSGSGGYLGIGFAVPSNIAKHVMDQLMKTGSVLRGFMGVTLQAITPDLAHAFNLKDNNGAIVADVSKDSPAQKAGLKQGDIIVAYNKVSVNSITSLRNAISLMNPGTQVSLTVQRDGKTLEIPLVVGAFPTTESKAAISSSNSKLGFEVQDLTPEIAKTLGIKDESGVVISKVDPNSFAALAGLKKGAVIITVNQEKVDNVDDFHAALKGLPANRPILLLIKQGEAIRFISIKVS